MIPIKKTNKNSALEFYNYLISDRSGHTGFCPLFLCIEPLCFRVPLKKRQPPVTADLAKGETKWQIIQGFGA